MDITDKTEWLYPVRLRVNKKVLPSRNVGVVFEPIISSSEWTGGYLPPDRIAGAEVILAGPEDIDDGRLEFWTKNTWTDEYPFVYYVFEHVEWCGSVGQSGTPFGFVYTSSRRSGRREWLSHISGAKK